ncbi:MAG: type III-A CRISPR-associated protein Csm2 [Microcoleaceae cyanobacterium]
MTQPPNKPNHPNKPNPSITTSPSNQNKHQQKQSDRNTENRRSEDITMTMVKKIDDLKTLKEYKIRHLVEDTAKLGETLVSKKLKTNQIRKFLDAVKRFKLQLRVNQELSKEDIFAEKKDELHILRYQLAYAAARQQKNKDPGPVEPLKQVLEAAIKKVTDLEDFNRFVQLIESIVAYHKAAGGKDQ